MDPTIDVFVAVVWLLIQEFPVQISTILMLIAIGYGYYTTSKRGNSK